MCLIVRSRLSNSSKNSGIDVNQSQYFTVMEVSLLNVLKHVHILCAWAILKRELPPSFDTQKQSNESALCFVSNSINQQVQPYNAAPLDIRIFTCAVRSHCTLTEWYTIIEKGRNLCASYTYLNKNFITLPETELLVEYTNNKGNTEVLFDNSLTGTRFNTTLPFIRQAGIQLLVILS
jgi:hypothetical protein